MTPFLATLLGLALGSLILWGILSWYVNRRYKKDIAMDLEQYNREVKIREMIRELEEMQRSLDK